MNLTKDLTTGLIERLEIPDNFSKRLFNKLNFLISNKKNKEEFINKFYDKNDCFVLCIGRYEKYLRKEKSRGLRPSASQINKLIQHKNYNSLKGILQEIFLEFISDEDLNKFVSYFLGQNIDFDRVVYWFENKNINKSFDRLLVELKNNRI